MKALLDSFWRAAAYCLHPRVIVLSLLPLLIAAASVMLLGWFFWEAAVAGVRGLLESWSLIAAMMRWLDSVGAAGFHAVLGPLIVVALALPVIVVVAMLLVAFLTLPFLVDMVARRRFPGLARQHGGGFASSAMHACACALVAFAALVVSLPLWLVPPFVLVLPPLIWGWLAYRVMSFDALAAHASIEERRQLLRAHRWQLLSMGVATGCLGAAPSLIWTFSALTLVFAPLLILVSIWLYTLVFAFAALWFAHYALSALALLRASPGVGSPPSAVAAVSEATSIPNTVMARNGHGAGSEGAFPPL